MSEPARYDYTVTAGNTFDFTVRVPFDCTGDEWVLRVVDGAGKQIARRAVSLASLALTQISSSPQKWQLSARLIAPETRAMLASGASYALERRVTGGEERTYLAGAFIVKNDANDD